MVPSIKNSPKNHGAIQGFNNDLAGIKSKESLQEKDQEYLRYQTLPSPKRKDSPIRSYYS